VKRSRIFYTVLCSVLLFLFCNQARADLPALEDKGKIQNGGVALKVDDHAAPTTVDWNNDGAKDLVVGEGSGGQIRLYLNLGTDLNPIFNGYTELKVNGNPIAMSNSG
jgi:hypothetical protein